MLARDRPGPTRDRPRPTPGPLPPDGGDLGGKPRPVRAIPGASRPRGAASCLPHWRRRSPFTNAVESASDQLRRATKNRGHSPLRRGRGRTPVATRAATAANAPKSETRTKANPPENAPLPTPKPRPRQPQNRPQHEPAPAPLRHYPHHLGPDTPGEPGPTSAQVAHQRAKWCSDALGGAAEHYATRPRAKWRSGATARGSRSTAHEAARSATNEPQPAPTTTHTSTGIRPHGDRAHTQQQGRPPHDDTTMRHTTPPSPAAASPFEQHGTTTSAVTVRGTSRRHGREGTSHKCAR